MRLDIRNELLPLGMTWSAYCDSSANIARRAQGYRTRNGQIMLHGGKVLSPTSYAELTAPGKLTEWATLRYGTGLGVYKDFNGLQLFDHGGINANGSPPRALFWLDASTFRFQGIVLTFHRSGDSGPATELGFNPAKGLYSILKRQ